VAPAALILCTAAAVGVAGYLVARGPVVLGVVVGMIALVNVWAAWWRP